MKKYGSFLNFCVLSLTLTGCQTVQKMMTVGEVPPLTPIENPEHLAQYQNIQTPLPSTLDTTHSKNSLWKSGARAFFKDQRANKKGDILTVEIKIDDKAEVDNNIKRSQDNSDNLNVGNLFGLEQAIAEKHLFHPNASPTQWLKTTSGPSVHNGNGEIKRKEKINLKLSAMVTQVLPNGNFVIVGRQETRINYEVREVIFHGIIRPEDITSANTIPYEKVAEARLSYGGRGDVMNNQRPPVGSQALAILKPF
jgi:flagellar L-ring protein precursor FlgH